MNTHTTTYNEKRLNAACRRLNRANRRIVRKQQAGCRDRHQWKNAAINDREERARKRYHRTANAAPYQWEGER